MEIDIQGIISGTKNAIFITEEIKKLSDYRLSICNTCEHYSPNIKKRGLQIFRLDKFCEDCGCNMYLKTKHLSAECPLGTQKSNFPNEKSKWSSLLDNVEFSEKLVEETEGLKQEVINYKTQLSQGKVDEHGS